MGKLEDKLAGYKNPSSDNEKDKQGRAKRMVQDAVKGWSGFERITYRILPKGSYANNTNVKADSDVDIAVIHDGFHYFDDSELPPNRKIKRSPVTSFHYDGADFRSELEKALRAKFRSQCDTSGKTAITVRETSSRVSIDVVPSFQYRKYYFDSLFGVQYHEGTKTRRANGTWVVNYPEQQLKNGRKKNRRTKGRYKHQVRILKRIENELVKAGKIGTLPSYFMECLVYNVPDGKLNPLLTTAPLTSGLKAVLSHICTATESGSSASWNEPNDIKKLFGDEQSWSVQDARDLAIKTWNQYKLGS